jgi:TonB family protein
MTVGRVLAIAMIAAASATVRTHGSEARQSQDLRGVHLRQTIWGGDDFVFVEQIGADVRMRAVRVAHASEYCPSLLVQAVERRFERTTVRAVAGIPICAMSQQRFERALKNAPDYRSYVDFVGGIIAVVADCDGRDKEFVFGFRPKVDFDKLRRQSPDVSAIADLTERMRKITLQKDSDDPFEGATPQERAAREALGTTLVPFLRAGRYAEYLERSLSKYTAPPTEREPSWSEIVDRESLNLAEYVEPTMPPIAISARVFGDVRVRIRADTTSGAVTNVEALSGSPLLMPSALEAIRKWRFAPGAAPTDTLDVTVRFRQRCPGEDTRKK